MDGNGLSPVWSPECPQVPGRGSRTGCNPSSYPACPHGWAGAAAAASCSPSHSAAERLLGPQGGSLHARKNRDWCLLHLLPVWALLTWLFAEWHKVRSRVVCPTTPLPKADAMCLPSQVDCGSRSSSSPGSSPAPSARSRKPGAVIESFVNHAPGVFSGTFSGTCCSIPGGLWGKVGSNGAVDLEGLLVSHPPLSPPPPGTLHPNCQDSSGRPRRDIGTILQILNDLLSATRHYQGMPQSLTQLRCQTQFSSSSSSSSSSPPASPDLATKTTSEPLPAAAAPTLHPVVQCQSQIRMCKPSGESGCPRVERGWGLGFVPLGGPWFHGWDEHRGTGNWRIDRCQSGGVAC